MLLSRAALRSLTRARELLELRDNDDSVTDIAHAVGMSPFHFIRVFEAVYGSTPHQLRIRSRLDRAKRLLAMDRSVTDVCMEIGFASVGSFSSAFTRRVGETPSAYQRRVRRLVHVGSSDSLGTDLTTALASALAPGCYSLMALLPADAFAISKKQASGGSVKLRP